MFKKSKILSLLLCFSLLFEQTGFAQVAGALDISGHLSAFRNQLIQDKFRPLHLRSLGYDNSQNNFRLLLDKGDLKNPKKPDLETTTKTLLNYFFVGVTLPNDTFWVNLRPDSENNIIDPDLATTDVGKILLEADLQLKKDTAKFTSPETPEGKEYWEKLYQKAGELLGYENITIPTLTRPWIVPGEIIIRETKDNAYIYKATLKVMLEQDYLKDSATYNFDDPRLKTLNEYSSQLIRDLIIPKLTKEVNTSQRYAPLRQVYYSLILAQWFKSRFYGKGGLYSWLIDRRGLQGLTSKISWSKTTYFKAYQKSFKDGEYNIQQPVYTPYGQTIRSYFSGGFVCNVPMPAVPAPGVAAERTEGPTKVTAISGDTEHSPLPRTDTVIGALAVGGNTMDPSETKVTITEEASSPSGLPAGSSQTGASSVTPTAITDEQSQATVTKASSPNLGAQVSDVKHLDRLLRLLNVLRRSENVPEVPENASDRDIMEFCIKYLQAKGLITTTTDEDGNVVITINNNALNHPDETVRRFVEAIQRWVINPEGGVRAVNFQGKDGVWMIVGFESELQNKDTLEHEQQEIKFRKQGLSWTEAHNQAVVETGKGQRIDREEAAKRRAGRQDEIGAMQGEEDINLAAKKSTGGIDFRKMTPKFSPLTESQLWNLMTDYMINVGKAKDMDKWRKQNPEKAKLLVEQFKIILGQNESLEAYIKALDYWKVVIDESDPKFKTLYVEVNKVLNRLLKAKGYNPKNFNLYLLDTKQYEAFVIRHSNTIFLSTGLLRFVMENGGSVDALAFIIAHELTHIDQWLDDVFEEKEIKGAEFSMRHADEHNADIEALALMDRAGFTVKEAASFFKLILSKKKDSKLAMVSHPMTDERIRQIEKLVSEKYWSSYFNKPTAFSEQMLEISKRKTQQREFEESIKECKSVKELLQLISEADSIEQLELAVIGVYRSVVTDKAQEQTVWQAVDQKLSQLSANNIGKQALYRIMRLLMYEIAVNEEYPHDIVNSSEFKKMLEGSDFETIMSILSNELPNGFFAVYTPQNYSHWHEMLMKYMVSHFLDKAFKELFSQLERKPEDIYKLKLFFGYLDKWIIQLKGTDDMHVGSDVINIILSQQIDFISKIFNSVEVSRMFTEQDIEELLNFLQLICVKHSGFRQNYYSSFQDVSGALWEYYKHTNRSIRNLVWQWLARVDAVNRQSGGGYFKHKVWEAYFYAIKSDETGIFLQDLGRTPKEAIEKLFSAEYLLEHYSHPWLFFLPLMGNTNSVPVLQGSLPWFVPTEREKLEIIDYMLERLATSERYQEDMYGSVFRELENIPADFIEEKLVSLGIHLSPHISPIVKRLIYLSSKGGIIKGKSFRLAVFSDDLTKEDLLALYQNMKPYEKNLMHRLYKEDSEEKQQSAWARYILPLRIQILYISLTGEKAPVYKRYEKFGDKQVLMDIDSRILDIFDNPFSWTYMDRRRDTKDPERLRADILTLAQILTHGSASLEEIMSYFNYIRDTGMNFDELFEQIDEILPASLYKNCALYVLFVEKKLKAEWGLDVPDTAIFNLQQMVQLLNRLSPQQQKESIRILSRIIIPSLNKDSYMEDLNKALMAKVASEGSKEVTSDIVTRHNSEQNEYQDYFETEPGGSLSQLDIFVPLLLRQHLLDFIKGTSSIEEKRNLILSLLPRHSNIRDYLLRVLLDNNSPSAQDIDSTLQYFNNDHFKEKYALEALELEKETHPERFTTLDAELERILHYFPELSYTRDDILLQLINERVNRPEDLAKLNKYLLQHPDNIRKKEQAKFTFYKDFIREMLKDKDANDKKDFLLWLLGISEDKPLFIINFEYQFKVSLDSLREVFGTRTGKYYKDVGDSARDDFIVSFLYGEKGVFTDEAAAKEFLDGIFETVLPGRTEGILKAIYDSVFRKRETDTLTDELRREGILLALLKNLAQLKSQDIIDAKQKEAKAIRAFLESMGVVGVKLGQFLSNFGYVPEHIQKELENLKDKARPLHKSVVFDMIKKIYGDFYNKFQELGELLGSASIKCVYKVKLANGQIAVLKVKRPEVEKKVQEDIAFLERVLEDVKTRLEKEDIAIPKNLVQRIQEIIQEELNFAQEAANQKELSQNLRNRAKARKALLRKAIFNQFVSKGRTKPRSEFSFVVPNATEVSNDALMIEEFVEGIPLSDKEALKGAGIDIDDVEIAVALELLKQMVVDGFYHADPHPGNIFVSKDGKTIYLIDLGAATVISLRNLVRLSILYQAIDSGDVEAIIKLVKSFDPSINESELRKEFNRIIQSRDTAVNKLLKVFHALDISQTNVPTELLSIFRLFGAAGDLFETVTGEVESSEVKDASIGSRIGLNFKLLLSKVLPKEKPRKLEKAQSKEPDFGTQFGGDSALMDSTGVGTKGSSPIDRGFEGDLGDVDAKAFSEAWRGGRSVEISKEQLGVLQDSSMGPAFRTPQVRLISRQIMDGIAQGANLVRLGNQVLVVDTYWNTLSEDERLDVLMHEGMADWLERERPGMPAEDAAIDLEGLKRNEAERRAGHRGEGQQTENANKALEDFSRSSAGEVAGSPVDQHVDTSEAAKTQTSSGQADKKGGIDFRTLPIINQQINMGMLKLSPADLNRLGKVNLDSEWGEIKNMVNAGIIPSNERIKEYVLASCLRQNLGNHMNKVLGCIADIMRMEEDRVVDADVELKDMLVLIEAGKPETELQCGLSQIKFSPQEPKLVVP